MIRLIPIILAVCILCTNAHAGQCDVYFPFDGSLADSSGNGHDGKMIAKDGDLPSARFADGKFGQALQLDGTSALRALVDLNYEACPEISFTAWIRVESIDVNSSQFLISTGGGSGPKLKFNGPNINLGGTGNGLSQSDALRDKNEWFFVAGRYNYATSTYSLNWRSREIEGSLSENRKLPEDALWVGAYNDRLSSMVQSAFIDELRFFGRFLSDEELRAIESGQKQASSNSSGSSVAGPGLAAASTASCADHTDCAQGSYCGWDNTCHPNNHAPKRDLTMGVVQVNPAPGGFITSGESDSAGMTVAEFNAQAAERNSLPEDAQNSLNDAINENRPPDLSSGSGSGSGNQSETMVPRGPVEGIGSMQVGDVLRSIDYAREPSGDVRDCHSFAEVTGDVATSVRDAIVTVASASACTLLTLPVHQTNAAASLADAAGYETDGFRERLLAETYGRCITTAEDISKIPDAAVKLWNSATDRNTWATIGPRRLTIGATQSGNLISPGDRKFITEYPVLDRNSAILALREIEGRARVTARVCTVSPFSVYKRIHAFSVNETPEERRDEEQLSFWNLNNIRGQQIIVVLDAAGRLGRNFRYELSVD